MKGGAILAFLVAASACDDGTGRNSPEIGSAARALGYPESEWAPADSSNFTPGNRGPEIIDLIVIHTAQGSYQGTINWFQDPAADVSAHYVVSSEGEVTQMVDDTDYSWHVLCEIENSIGLEHEGFVDDPETWYTEAMYDRSARLSAWLSNQYGIPKDRDHIIGHNELPCTDHTDPGAGWDWDVYMDLVETYGELEYGATPVAGEAPMQLESGEDGFVWLEWRNDGNFTWDPQATLLGVPEADGGSELYFDGVWVDAVHATGPDSALAYPGETVIFSFPVRAPVVEEETVVREVFQLSHEGVWFGETRELEIAVTPGEPPPEPQELGAACGQDAECTSGLCGHLGDESRCTQRCASDEECPGGFACVEGGACWPQESGGAGGCQGGGSSGSGAALALALLLGWRRRRK